MLESWAINTLGIILTAGGLIILLIKFIIKKIEKKTFRDLPKHFEKQNQDLNKHRKLPLLYRIWSTKILEKIPAGVGIIMTIVGVLFYLININ